MPTFRIKELAHERGFTTEQLARHSNVKFATVRNIWQNRIQEPTFSTLKALARALEVSIEELEACEESLHEQQEQTRTATRTPTNKRSRTSVSRA